MKQMNQRDAIHFIATRQEFKASALKCLRNGENTLAVSTRQNWRWGMLFMYVYNDGFDFNLDARLKKKS